jgi:peptidoglycan biosynthesis/recognition FemAB-like protein
MFLQTMSSCEGSGIAAAVRRASEFEWSQFASSLWGYGYQQTWAYGQELAGRRGAASEHLLIIEGDRLLGAADVRFKRIPIIGGGLAYVSGGPLLSLHPENDKFASFLGKTIQALREEYTVRRGCVLRIALPVGMVDSRVSVAEVFNRIGYREIERHEDSIRPYRTMRLDITGSLKEIRARFDQKWRNALNGALKQNLSVSVWDDAESITRFGSLFDSFVNRKGFMVDLGPTFYGQVQRRLPLEERLVVQLVKQDGDVVAGHVSSMLGDTCVYLLGATSTAGLRSKAAYLLQWNTIVLAKEKGLRWYDLGGVDPVANPGVYHFKRGLGGEDVTAPGPFEASPSPWRGMVVRHAEAVHRILASRETGRQARAQRANSIEEDRR